MQEPNPDARAAGKVLIAEKKPAGPERKAFIYVNNRLEAFNHLSQQLKPVADRKILQEKSLHGCEPKTMPYLLCQMNLLLHGLDAPQIDPGNSLRFLALPGFFKRLVDDRRCQFFRILFGRIAITKPALGKHRRIACTLLALLRKSLIINNGAGEGNRTLISGLGSPHSTTEPHPLPSSLVYQRGEGRATNLRSSPTSAYFRRGAIKSGIMVRRRFFIESWSGWRRT